jgi:hypothetical protein
MRGIHRAEDAHALIVHGDFALGKQRERQQNKKEGSQDGQCHSGKYTEIEIGSCEA